MSKKLFLKFLFNFNKHLRLNTIHAFNRRIVHQIYPRLIKEKRDTNFTYDNIEFAYRYEIIL